jgi:SAM-dependent methyltransferase
MSQRHHPVDLQRRRQRCGPIVNTLRELDKEFVSQCNICESSRSAIISDCDRYGFQARTAMCLGCGLIYHLDRLTSPGYAQFYATGTYRTLSTLYNGSGGTVESLQVDQANYVKALGTALDGYISKGHRRLLDVGGGPGVVAHELAMRFGMAPTVLEPSPYEAAAAQRLGARVVVDSIENWKPQEQFDLILLCRAIEHLNDLRRSLTTIRDLLAPGGLFYCDFLDFADMVRGQSGSIDAVAKIDHCYWLHQENAPAIFRSIGFEIVSINTTFGSTQVGFLLQPCAPAWPPAVSKQWLEAQLRFLRRSAGHWEQLGGTPYDLHDSIRRSAYTWTRRARRVLRFSRVVAVDPIANRNRERSLSGN